MASVIAKCKWCKRAWGQEIIVAGDSYVVTRRRAGCLICIICDKYMYQAEVDLDTQEKKLIKLETMSADPSLQADWNRRTLENATRGRQYNKSGKHAQPEREGLDDDVLRTQGRQLEGKKILGYFCQNKDWKKIWPEGKPRKSKAFCWDEQNGFLVDLSCVPLVAGHIPGELTAITERVFDGVRRNTDIAKDRYVGDTDKMNSVWGNAVESQRLAVCRKGKASKAEDAPKLLGLAFKSELETEELTGEGADQTSSALALLWDKSLFDVCDAADSIEDTESPRDAVEPKTKKSRSNTPRKEEEMLEVVARKIDAPLTRDEEMEISKEVVNEAAALVRKVEEGTVEVGMIVDFDAVNEKVRGRMSTSLSGLYLEDMSAGDNPGMKLLEELGNALSVAGYCRDVLVAMFDQDLEWNVCSVLDLVIAGMEHVKVNICSEHCHGLRWEQGLAESFANKRFETMTTQLMDTTLRNTYTLGRVATQRRPEFQRKWLGKVLTAILMGPGNLHALRSVVETIMESIHGEVHQAEVQDAEVHQAEVHQADVQDAAVHQAEVHQAKVHQAKVHQAEVHQAKVHQAERPQLLDTWLRDVAPALSVLLDPLQHTAAVLKKTLLEAKCPTFMLQVPFVHGQTGKELQGIVEDARLKMLQDDDMEAFIAQVNPPCTMALTDGSCGGGVQVVTKFKLSQSEDCNPSKVLLYGVGGGGGVG